MVVEAVTVPVEDGVKRLFGIGREEPAQKATDLQLVVRQAAFEGSTDGWIAPGKTLPEGAEPVRRWEGRHHRHQ
ncbi:hypothetical protein [Streptomyces sp. NPDC059708]|uniref:hypothetical protein n=1 Tax=Streptomyces sp. NPDC059708 TaxID=3346916 RepID=UPI00368955C1